MVTILNRMIRGTFVEKIVLKQKPDGGETSHGLSGGDTGKGNIICKDPEAVACLAHSKESKEAHVAAVERVSKRERGNGHPDPDPCRPF